MVKFKLQEVMKVKGIKSLAELIRLSKNHHPGVGLRRDTLMGMRDGTLKRIDLKLIDTLCKVLNCNVKDLIAYVPDNGTKVTK